MALPFIKLGTKAATHLIDNHFEKIPDKYVRGETYVPARFSKIKRRHLERAKAEARRKDSGDDSDSGSDSEASNNMQQERTYRDQDVAGIPEYSQESPYITPPIYSREPPRQRDRYMPSPPPMGGAYGAPPSSAGRSRGRRDSFSDDEEDYDGYRARRPQAMRRRSSSYHGPRSTYDDGFSQVQKSRGTGSEHVDRAIERADRYKLKDEVLGQFSKSKVGLGGGAVGALVGGWAAEKAQVGYAKGRHPKSNPLITALGAAAAGLAVNALVEKWEVSREHSQSESKDYDERDGRAGDRDSDTGRGSETGRNRRSGRSRRDSRGYNSDGYD
jgi:hypothetical protein